MATGKRGKNVSGPTTDQRFPTKRGLRYRNRAIHTWYVHMTTSLSGVGPRDSCPKDQQSRLRQYETTVDS